MTEKELKKASEKLWLQLENLEFSWYFKYLWYDRLLSYGKFFKNRNVYSILKGGSLVYWFNMGSKSFGSYSNLGTCLHDFESS